ncbi:MAG: response regulator [Betaproteobacteria bacterium]
MLRALVVDDDDTMVEFVSAVLRRAGYDVHTCGDGMAALELFRAHPFDVAVVDVRMPKLSGISFLKNLRLPQGSPHRIVLLSAQIDKKLEREALDAGAAACLLKPATSAAILAAVAPPVSP